MLTAKFKDNIKKIKPIYDEIIKLTPTLTEKLLGSLQKQNAQNNQSKTTSEKQRTNQNMFASIGSNSSFGSSSYSNLNQESNEAVMKSILKLAQTIKSQIR